MDGDRVKSKARIVYFPAVFFMFAAPCAWKRCRPRDIDLARIILKKLALWRENPRPRCRAFAGSAQNTS